MDQGRGAANADAARFGGRHLKVALFSDAGRSWATNASIASKLASLSPSQIANLRTIRAIASQRGPARSGRPDNKLREAIELGHELSGY